MQAKFDVENKLLDRREVNYCFPHAAGHLTRIDAIKAVAETLGVDPKTVYLVILSTKSGSRDVEGIFYVYTKPDNAKRDLTRHIFERMLSKEERQKAKDELSRKAKSVKPAIAEKKV